MSECRPKLKYCDACLTPAAASLQTAQWKLATPVPVSKHAPQPRDAESQALDPPWWSTLAIPGCRFLRTTMVVRQRQTLRTRTTRPLLGACTRRKSFALPLSKLQYFAHLRPRLSAKLWNLARRCVTPLPAKLPLTEQTYHVCISEPFQRINRRTLAYTISISISSNLWVSKIRFKRFASSAYVAC